MVGFLTNERNCLSGRLSDYDSLYCLSRRLPDYDSLSGILSFYINDSTYNQAINLGFVGTKSDLLDLIISSVEGTYYLSDESNNYLTDEQGNILFTR